MSIISLRSATQVFPGLGLPESWRQIEYNGSLYWLWSRKKGPSGEDFVVTKEEDFGKVYRRHEITVKPSGYAACDCEGAMRNADSVCRHIEMLKFVQTTSSKEPTTMATTYTDNSVLQAIRILGKLAKSSNSRLEKAAILELGKKNKPLKNLLRWTYSGDVYYTYPTSVPKKVPELVAVSGIAAKFDDFTNLLQDLKARKVTGGEAQKRVDGFFSKLPSLLQVWFGRVMNHDLRVGVQTTMTEAVFGDKIWGSNAVKGKGGSVTRYPGCQLAHVYQEWPGWKYAHVEPKLDGYRLTAVVVKGQAAFYSRKGKHEPYTENLSHIGEQIVDIFGKGPYALDGEIIVENWNKTGVIKNKNLNAKIKTILRDRARFHAFDYLPLTEKCKLADPDMPFFKRRRILFEKLGKKGTRNVKLVPRCRVTSDKEIGKAFDKALSKGFEGIVVKNPMSPYKFNRNKGWLKVKPEKDVDAKVIGWEKGTGKNANRLGAFIVKTAEGVKFKVGSGFSDEQRTSWWKKRESYKGKWLEAKVQDATDVATARHPRFARWRVDKDE